MKRIRLLAFDPSGVVERTYSRFPVRLGRHPENDFQIIDPRISRFHAEIFSESDALVFRDLSQNGSLVTVGVAAPAQMVRGADVRAPDGRLTLLVGGTRVEATLEESDATKLPETFASAVRDAALATSSACDLCGDREFARVPMIRPVLDALSDGLLMMRLALHTQEQDALSDHVARRVEPEASTALLEWVHATGRAICLVEECIDVAAVRDAALLSDATDAIDSLLRELAPDKIDRETTDVCAAWPAARATTVLARYRAVHERLAERHRRIPSVLRGSTFAEVRGRGLADVCATERGATVAVATPKVQDERADAGPAAPDATASDVEAQPPSGDG